MVWHDWREGKLLQIPQTPERQNLREMLSFKMDPPGPTPSMLAEEGGACEEGDKGRKFNLG